MSDNMRVEALVMATLMAGEVTEPILAEARAIQADLDKHANVVTSAQLICDARNVARHLEHDGGDRTTIVLLRALASRLVGTLDIDTQVWVSEYDAYRD